MLKKAFKHALQGILATSILSTQVRAEDDYASCCPPISDCCIPYSCDSFSIDAEYLYWQIKNSPEPVPVVTSGSTVVLGGKNIDNDWRSGGRFAIGYWFDDSECFGIDANYFFLGNGSKSQSISSSGLPGSPNLNIPFFDVITETASSTALSSSTLIPPFAGSATLKISNYMQGAELNGVSTILSDCSFKVGILAGFRYWNFDEHLSFSTNSPNVSGNDVFQTIDKFHARNNFYGGQIGMGFEYSYNCFFLDIQGKLALGAMYENAIINGELLTNDFSLPAFSTIEAFSGGYFALPSNIGNHKRTQFSVIPEVNVDIGYQVCDWLRVKVGYTFMYVSEMLWVGREIDPNINPTQSVAIEGNSAAILVGQASPSPRFGSDSLWTQGVSAGIDFRF